MSESSPTDDALPPAKRARTNIENIIQNSDDIKLDHLHIDHLRPILDYLSIDDIIGSMTVSKQWRANILEYLKDSRFCFEYYYLPRTHFVPRLLGLVDDLHHKRAMPFDKSHGDSRDFLKKIEELGPAIVSIALDHLDETRLNIIVQNCPNLQGLMLVGLQPRPALEQQETVVRPQINHQHGARVLPLTKEGRQCLQHLQLKRVSFVHSPNATEDYISDFLQCDYVEEIIICRNRTVEGRCLSGLKSDLKSLRLIACSLKFIHLKAIFDRLAALTILDLSNNPTEILQSVHRLLEKTPNLEGLFLNSYEQTNVGNELVESLRRLGRLKHLSLCWNDNVSDAWLQAVAAGCPKLQTVDIETTRPTLAVVVEPMAGLMGPDRRNGRAAVSAAGVQALCRGALKLKHLGLAGRSIVDSAQLAACVSVCPDLESVDLRGSQGCPLVDWSLPALADAVRGRARALKRLRLQLARSTAVNRLDQAHAPEGLIYDFVDAPREFRLV